MPKPKKKKHTYSPVLLRAKSSFQNPLYLGVVLLAVVATGYGVYRSSHADSNSASSAVSEQREFLDPVHVAATRTSLPPAALNATNCGLFETAALCHGKGLTLSPMPPTASPTPGAETLTAEATGAGCITAGCGQLTWHGGPIQRSPKVVFIEWGPKWSADTSMTPTVKKIMGSIGVEDYSAAPDRWSTTTAQYFDGGGAASFYAGVGTKTVVDTTTPPYGCNQGCIANEALAVAKNMGISSANYENYQMVVATESGTCPQNFLGDAAGCPAPAAGSAYCGYHTFASGGLPFINLPWYPDSVGCKGPLAVQDGYGAAMLHEYAETVTSPWLNGWNNVGGGEIADECPGYKSVNMKLGGIVVQSLYSNAAKGCVYSSGVQGSVIGLGSKCVDDHSSGFNNGNPIDLWGCNHTDAQRIVYYPDHTLRVMGKCLNDKGSGGNGSPVVLYDCNGGSNEIWTHDSTNGEFVLKANSKCLNVKGNNTTNGTALVMYTCNGASNEKWSLPRAW